MYHPAQPTRSRLVASLSLTAFLLGSAATVHAAVFQEIKPPLPVKLREVVTAPGPLTGVAHAGDDRLFLVVRDGRVLILRNGQLLAQPFLDLRGRLNLSGEGGLLSIAFHPDYAENGTFFVNYTNKARAIVVARYNVLANNPNRANAASAKVLLTLPKEKPFHNGGDLHFGPDGYLYVSVGDGAANGTVNCNAQDGRNLFGKILRLDVDSRADRAPFYAIPADNPFREGGPTRAEIWANGLRNPWRFSFDRQTGDLYIGDVGNTKREEINFLAAGAPGGENFGWKVMEGSACFRGNGCPAATPACRSAQYTTPVLEYAHASGCAVTGGYVYRGSALPSLHGTYVFGDFCSGKLWGAKRENGTWKVHALSATAALATSFGEDSAGEVFVATHGGKLFQLVAAP